VLIGHTPAAQAAANGRLDCVSKLISMGAEVDGLTDLAWPPLFAATNNGSSLIFGLMALLALCVWH
jgi:ankyrin repeat protein